MVLKFKPRPNYQFSMVFHFLRNDAYLIEISLSAPYHHRCGDKNLHRPIAEYFRFHYRVECFQFQNYMNRMKNAAD